jgi:hypothetical protein
MRGGSLLGNADALGSQLRDHVVHSGFELVHLGLGAVNLLAEVFEPIGPKLSVSPQPLLLQKLPEYLLGLLAIQLEGRLPLAIGALPLQTLQPLGFFPPSLLQTQLLVARAHPLRFVSPRLLLPDFHQLQVSFRQD